MQLTKKSIFEVVPTSPFNFDKTFFKPDHFTSGDNLWEPETRWQTWKWFGKDLGIKLENVGSVKNPKMKITVFSQENLGKEFFDSLLKEIKYRYNLDLDLDEFYNAFEKDKVLRPIIKKMYGMRPGHPSSLYEYLIIGVVLQNASVRRSIQMFKALLENYGTKVTFDNNTLWCFWEPGRLKNITVEDLRNLKVGYRAKFIKKIDEHFSSRLIDETSLRNKDREFQRNELLKLYGVGPATVWYLLFDVFHHWDYFNHVSPWECKIYTKLLLGKDPYKPSTEKVLLGKIARYGKYKHLVIHYLWEELWWSYKEGRAPWLKEFIKV